MSVVSSLEPLVEIPIVPLGSTVAPFGPPGGDQEVVLGEADLSIAQ
jgi:hypothetical protein